MNRAARISDIIQTYSAQGDHRTGTDVDERSARWLASEIESIGVSAELDSFSFDRVSVVNAGLTAGALTLPGVPLYDCSATDGAGIVARLGDPGEPGTIAIIRISASDGGSGARKLQELRSDSIHPAIVVMSDSEGSAAGPAVLNAEAFREPFGVPVLQLPFQLESTLRKLSRQREQVSLIAQTLRAPARASNVQAQIDGRDPGAAPLVVMTPRSGWWRCASERGGGIAAFLEIMRAMRQNQPRRPVIFTANTGHELSHLGLDHFLSQQPELIQQAFAWIHLGANFAAANAPVRLQFSDTELQTISQAHLTESGLAPDQVTPLEQRPLGEARNVFDGGGRYVSVLGGNRLFHHPDDVWPDAVDIDKTTAWISAITAIAQQLAG